MAESPKKVRKILSGFARNAREKAREEWVLLKDFSKLKQFEMWDIPYYSEKLRHVCFHIDQKKLREYFPLEEVLRGLFETGKKLFGLTFRRIGAPQYAEDVLTYEVYEGEKLIAYFVFDLFARPEKRGGAWCNDLRSKRKGAVPIVVNVGNFAKGTASHPTLLTHTDVITMFHEFGHGLHVLLSKNQYPNTDGFHTEWDFVELPSQLLENWAWHQEGLKLFAKHYKTKKPLPQDLIFQLGESRVFLKGLFLLRQIEFGFLDFFLHTEPVSRSVPILDERILKIVNKYSVKRKFSSYKMYASFGHIFSGGYAAGYYSYLWAEILEADIFSRFAEKGVFDEKLGKKFKKEILEPGAKKNGAELFRSFMGRGPDSNSLLKKMGLIAKE